MQRFYENNRWQQTKCSFEFYEEKSRRWYMISAFTVEELYADKYPICYSLITDITELKEAHIKLHKKEEEYIHLFNKMKEYELYQQKKHECDRYLAIINLSSDIIFEYDIYSDTIQYYGERAKQSKQIGRAHV